MTQNEHVYAICSRPEVGGDVISGQCAKITQGYVVVNFEVAKVATSYSFQRIKKSIRNGGGGGECEHRPQH